MTLPVSIGDAILLSTLAFRLGHAFTSGRKSAPDEFQEVQNQLFSLGKALEVLASCRKMAFKVQDDNEITTSQSGEPEQHDDVIALMVSNCRTTLHHLELIVDKYTELKRDAKKPEPVGGKRWREELKQNWKKLRWTTEGGDVDKLRGNLNVHINGLNLAISAINRSVVTLLGPIIHLFGVLTACLLNTARRPKMSRNELMKFTECWMKFTYGLRQT